MTTDKIVKKNLLLEDGKLTIFGAKGYESHGYWITNALDPNIPMTRTQPMPFGKTIASTINDDIANGNFDKIDHIVVVPGVALFLYLEGRLTTEDIKNAESNGQTIIFKSIKFGSYKGEVEYDIVVDPKMTKYFCVTVDKNGKTF